MKYLIIVAMCALTMACGSKTENSNSVDAASIQAEKSADGKLLSGKYAAGKAFYIVFNSDGTFENVHSTFKESGKYSVVGNEIYLNGGPSNTTILDADRISLSHTIYTKTSKD